MGKLDLTAEGVKAARADRVAEDLANILIPGLFEIAKLIGNGIKDLNLYECITQNGISQIINIEEFKDNILLKEGAFVIIQLDSFKYGGKQYFLTRILEDGVIKALMNRGIWPDHAEFQVGYD